MNTTTLLPVALRLLAAALPLTLLLGALLARPDRPFVAARRATSAVAAMALAVVVGAWVGTPPLVAPDGPLHLLDRHLALDRVTGLVLALVATLGVVIVRYSATDLRDDGGRLRYVRALLVTLAAVHLLVVANHLAVLAAAWIASSLALHQLLTHVRDRPQALIAAHKKFLVSRMADVCVITAIALLGSAAGTLHLDALARWAQPRTSLPPAAELAALLLVVGVALKSAQLPFHGWLMQVMEAPTPVSALLHAGVVNIGGFVLIRLAGVVSLAPSAMLLLVAVGTTTAVVASLVQTAQPSIKVALAWSTCAQMGLMLMECGLGAWHVALLHLVAHSLYKAHAFLSAGSVVDAWTVRTQAAPRPRPSLSQTLAGVALTSAALAIGWSAVAVWVDEARHVAPASVPLVALLVLGLAPAVAGLGGTTPRVAAAMAARIAAVGLAFLAAHLAFDGLLAAPPPSGLVAWWGAGIATTGLVALFVTHTATRTAPDGPLATALRPHLLAGLHLDATFTRLTFAVWPPALPARVDRATVPPLASTLEA